MITRLILFWDLLYMLIFSVISAVLVFCFGFLTSPLFHLSFLIKLFIYLFSFSIHCCCCFVINNVTGKQVERRMNHLSESFVRVCSYFFSELEKLYWIRFVIQRGEKCSSNEFMHRHKLINVFKYKFSAKSFCWCIMHSLYVRYTLPFSMRSRTIFSCSSSCFINNWTLGYS